MIINIILGVYNLSRATIRFYVTLSRNVINVSLGPMRKYKINVDKVKNWFLM